MKFIEYNQKIDAIKYMAEHRRTGSPQQLAARLNVSERTIERMAQQLREIGYPIFFDRFRNSYIIQEETKKKKFDLFGDTFWRHGELYLQRLMNHG